MRDDEGVPAVAPVPVEGVKANGEGETLAGGEGGESKATAPIATDFAAAPVEADELKQKDGEGEERDGLPELVSPFPAELPPYPTTLRTIDVAREVEKVREARKRIKLGAEAYAPGAGGPTAQLPGGKREMGEAAKPSVCLFTVHDAGER